MCVRYAEPAPFILLPVLASYVAREHLVKLESDVLSTWLLTCFTEKFS